MHTHSPGRHGLDVKEKGSFSTKIALAGPLGNPDDPLKLAVGRHDGS